MARSAAKAFVALTAVLLAVAPSAGVAQADASEPFAVKVRPVAAFGVAGGFPGYQTGTALASVQYRFVGAALRVGYGTAGVQASIDARGYAPVPIPVPLYGAVGLNLYGSRVAYHGAVGAHVPLDLRWRLDLEAGVAWAPVLHERVVAPHVVIGVSYAIPFDPSSFAAAEPGGGSSPSGFEVGDARGCPAPSDPDTSAGAIASAVARVVDTFLSDAQAVYGSVYTDVRYGWDVVGVSVDGTRARVEIVYRGSVREVATGERISAEGVAHATFVWTGCRWSSTGVSY